MLKNVLVENAVLRIIDQKYFGECGNDIKQIKAEYLTKDDFIREKSKIDRKLDRMLEMMINRQE